MRGVTPELFYGDQGRPGLKDLFTVDSPTGVNLRTASPAVCVALIGLSVEKCQEFIAQRSQLSEKTLADLLRLLARAARWSQRGDVELIALGALRALGAASEDELQTAHQLDRTAHARAFRPSAEETLRRVIADPEVSSKLKAMAVNPGGGPSEEFRAMIDADIKAAAEVAKAAKLEFKE